MGFGAAVPDVGHASSLSRTSPDATPPKRSGRESSRRLMRSETPRMEVREGESLARPRRAFIAVRAAELRSVRHRPTASGASQFEVPDPAVSSPTASFYSHRRSDWDWRQPPPRERRRVSLWVGGRCGIDFLRSEEIQGFGRKVCWIDAGRILGFSLLGFPSPGEGEGRLFAKRTTGEVHRLKIMKRALA